MLSQLVPTVQIRPRADMRINIFPGTQRGTSPAFADIEPRYGARHHIERHTHMDVKLHQQENRERKWWLHLNVYLGWVGIHLTIGFSSTRKVRDLP